MIAKVSSFWAVDVETATQARGAICQIGIVKFDNGRPVQQQAVLIKPPDAFHASHTRLHGITVARVQDAPLWAEAFPGIARDFDGQTLLSHSAFDRRQIFAACCRSGARMFSYRRWLDSCAQARKAWPGLPSYSLPALAARMGILYRAHDAAEDARAAGELWLLAEEELASRAASG